MTDLYSSLPAGMPAAADYASLPGGQANGTEYYCTDTKTVWKYNTTTGLWLPPSIQPTVLLEDYAAAALPDASVPAWTKVGVSACSVAGGELTIDDTAVDSVQWQRTDAVNIDSSKNCAFLMRIKVTAEDVQPQSNKVFFGFTRLGTLSRNCIIGLAYGAAVGAANGNVGMGPYNASGSTTFAGTFDVNATTYQWYWLAYYTATNMFHGGLLGYERLWSEWGGWAEAAGTDGRLNFGCYSAGRTSTVIISNIKIFNFA